MCDMVDDMKRKLLRTVDEVVEAFGGDIIVAEWLGLSRPAVVNWRMRQNIPSTYHMRIWFEAQSMGYRIDPQLLGLHGWIPLSEIRNRTSSVA